jgi:hypothetical protein
MFGTVFLRYFKSSFSVFLSSNKQENSAIREAQEERSCFLPWMSKKTGSFSSLWEVFAKKPYQTVINSLKYKFELGQLNKSNKTTQFHLSIKIKQFRNHRSDQTRTDRGET